MAVVAGALKDAVEETRKGHSVEAPIFARKDFERLEAEGWREFGDRIQEWRDRKRG